MQPTADRARPRSDVGAGAGGRFLLRFLLVGAPLYAILFYPHAPDSLPAAALSTYLELLARSTAGLISAFDGSVTVDGHLIGGRTQLAVVIDCAAFDVQATLGAATLAFPAPWSQRLLGLGFGVLALTALNLLRIGTLYFVSPGRPSLFGLLHEDLFPLALVLTAVAAFARWALRASRSARLAAELR